MCVEDSVTLGFDYKKYIRQPVSCCEKLRFEIDRRQS